MPTLLEQMTIEDKAKELCQTILDDPAFSGAHTKIEAFVADESAQDAYRAWQDKAQELHRMGHEGLEPNNGDLVELEKLKAAVISNPVASGFLESESALNDIFGSVTKLVQKTIQLGRMPAEEDLVESGGCCGGSGGGGCGC